MLKIGIVVKLLMNAQVSGDTLTSVPFVIGQYLDKWIEQTWLQFYNFSKCCINYQNCDVIYPGSSTPILSSMNSGHKHYNSTYSSKKSHILCTESPNQIKFTHWQHLLLISLLIFHKILLSFSDPSMHHNYL